MSGIPGIAGNILGQSIVGQVLGLGQQDGAQGAEGSEGGGGGGLGGLLEKLPGVQILNQVTGSGQTGGGKV